MFLKKVKAHTCMSSYNYIFTARELYKFFTIQLKYEVTVFMD